MAAMIQAGIGNVAAGSPFATAVAGTEDAGGESAGEGAGGAATGGPADAAAASANASAAGADAAAAFDEGIAAGARVVRTGPNRCRKCKRGGRRFCRHDPHHDSSSSPNPGF
jgi:hypothetical protein